MLGVIKNFNFLHFNTGYFLLQFFLDFFSLLSLLSSSSAPISGLLFQTVLSQEHHQFWSKQIESVSKEFINHFTWAGLQMQWICIIF